MTSMAGSSRSHACTTKTTGLWTLYWRDRNLKFHRYQPLDPSPRVRELLDYLDKHADPIFWG